MRIFKRDPSTHVKMRSTLILGETWWSVSCWNISILYHQISLFLPSCPSLEWLPFTCSHLVHGFSCPLGWPHSESLLPPKQPLPFASWYLICVIIRFHSAYWLLYSNTSNKYLLFNSIYCSQAGYRALLPGGGCRSEYNYHLLCAPLHDREVMDLVLEWRIM